MPPVHHEANTQCNHSFLQHLNLTSHLCHWTETRALGKNKLKRERPQLADAGWLKHVALLL